MSTSGVNKPKNKEKQLVGLRVVGRAEPITPQFTARRKRSLSNPLHRLDVVAQAMRKDTETDALGLKPGFMGRSLES